MKFIAIPCPLCQSQSVAPYHQDKDAHYLSCSRCDLVFMDKAYHLSEKQEKLRYDQHQNNPDDRNYQAFLSQVFKPVKAQIKKGAKGLDFGSGPGPTLSLMFEKSGHQMDLFDKFYANNPEVFQRHYDFITATEVFEHLSDPGFELERLFATLKIGGVLAIMTQMITKEVDFPTWYYKNDPTHICFFSKKTMRYLAQQWGVKVKFFAGNVVLFTS